MKENRMELSQRAPALTQELAAPMGGFALNLAELTINPDTPPEVLYRLGVYLNEQGGDLYQRGLCIRAEDGDIFFPESSSRRAALPAIGICNWCPIRVQCLWDAIQNNEKDGVRGGMSARERRAYVKQHGLDKPAVKVKPGPAPEQ